MLLKVWLPVAIILALMVDIVVTVSRESPPPPPDVTHYPYINEEASKLLDQHCDDLPPPKDVQCMRDQLDYLHPAWDECQMSDYNNEQLMHFWATKAKQTVAAETRYEKLLNGPWSELCKLQIDNILRSNNSDSTSMDDLVSCEACFLEDQSLEDAEWYRRDSLLILESDLIAQIGWYRDECKCPD
jgi:hypothetical protein